MKTKNILHSIFAILTVSLTLVTSASQDGDWDIPSFKNGYPYGNNKLEETNVVSITELKAMFANYLTTFSCEEITENIQLRVRVTGNDISGNLYQSIAVQEDETGDAMIVSIGGSNLAGYLPVGQEILIELKGLYIGCYGMQPQIGIAYTNASGRTYPSRISNHMWQEHFKIIGAAEPDKVVPYEFTGQPNVRTDAGRLMTIKNVSVKGANGKVTWASEADAGGRTAVSKYFDGYSENFMIYTSIYADFANMPIPTGKLNLTGIWKVYQSSDEGTTKWELIIRDINDVEVAKEEPGPTPGNDNVDDGSQIDPTQGNGTQPGTINQSITE